MHIGEPYTQLVPTGNRGVDLAADAARYRAGRSMRKVSMVRDLGEDRSDVLKDEGGKRPVQVIFAVSGRDVRDDGTASS